MAAATYGTTNPGGIDPFPIEQSLASIIATNNPARGEQLLQDYHVQNEASQNAYNQDMQAQHEFAKQQLAQQMAEARMKLIPEVIGKPGGGAFLAGGGIEGLGPAGGGTGNAGAWAGLGQAGQQYDFAKNLAEEGRGIESFSRAGQDVAIQQLPGLQNLQTTGAGEHSDISVERIKAATALQTAAMHAKSAAAAGLRVPITIEDSQGNRVTVPTKVPANATDAQLADSGANTRRIIKGVLGADATTNLPGAVVPTGATTTQSTTPTQPPAPVVVPGRLGSSPAAPSRTGLVNAPAPAAAAPKVVGDQFLTDPKAQAIGARMLQYLPPDARAQVVAAIPKGTTTLLMVPLSDGTAGFVGKDGRVHAVPKTGGPQ